MPEINRPVSAEEMESGLAPSLHLLDRPFWAEGENVLFRDQGVRKVRGWVSIFDAPAVKPVMGLAQQRRLNSTQHLYWGDDENLYHWDVASVTNVSRSGGYNGVSNATITTPASLWAMAIFGDWVIASNGEDPLQLFKPSVGNFEDVTTPFDWAHTLLQRGPYTLAIHTSDGPDRVQWSNLDDPEDWEITAEKTAGFLQFREATSPLVAAAPLGELDAIYSGNEMFILDFQGTGLIFTYRKVQDSLGAVGKAAVVSVGTKNYGVHRSGIWVTDGTQHQYIDDPAIRSHLLGNVNWDQRSKIVAHHNLDQEQVEFYFPMGTSTEPNEGWAFRYHNGTWTKLDFGRTAAVPRSVFRHPVMADASGKVYFHETGEDADGEVLPARVRTKPLAFQSVKRVKLIRKLQVLLRDAEGADGLRVRLGWQNRLDREIQWGPWRQPSESMQEIDQRVSGEYITMEFESRALGDDWALSGLMFEGRYKGARI